MQLKRTLRWMTTDRAGSLPRLHLVQYRPNRLSKTRPRASLMKSPQLMEAACPTHLNVRPIDSIRPNVLPTPLFSQTPRGRGSLRNPLCPPLQKGDRGDFELILPLTDLQTAKPKPVRSIRCIRQGQILFRRPFGPSCHRLQRDTPLKNRHGPMKLPGLLRTDGLNYRPCGLCLADKMKHRGKSGNGVTAVIWNRKGSYGTGSIFAGTYGTAFELLIESIGSCHPTNRGSETKILDWRRIHGQGPCRPPAAVHRRRDDMAGTRPFIRRLSI